jgi:hypothetical protein
MNQHDKLEAEVLLELLVNRVTALTEQNTTLRRQVRQAQQPAKPKPTPQAPRPTPPPMAAKTAPLRTMREAKAAALVELSRDVPPAPDTLGQALEWRKTLLGY